MRTPFGLGKHISLEYIDVASGLTGVIVNGLVGWMSKRKCCRMNPKYSNELIAMRTRIMCWCMMLPMTVLLMVVKPVVGLVLLSRQSLFLLYFC